MFHRTRVLRPIDDPFCVEHEPGHRHTSYCRPDDKPACPNSLLINRHIRKIGFGFHTCMIKQRKGRPKLYWEAEGIEKLFMHNLEKVGAKNLELVFLADLFLRGKHALGPFYEEELSMPLDSLGECFSEVTLYLSCVDSTYVWREDKPYLGSLDDATEAARNCVLRMVGSEMDVVEEATILDATDDERLLIVSFKRDFGE
jgi:hypothetical protein